MPTSETPTAATTLPARYYTDPDLFHEELERFYCQDWICVGRVNQIPEPGDYFLREVAGECLSAHPRSAYTCHPRETEF